MGDLNIKKLKDYENIRLGDENNRRFGVQEKASLGFRGV